MCYEYTEHGSKIIMEGFNKSRRTQNKVVVQFANLITLSESMPIENECEETNSSAYQPTASTPPIRRSTQITYQPDQYNPSSH